MHAHFDPRTWNLVAGVALLTAGCGSRGSGQEGGETGETADSNSETPECTVDGDCPTGYDCQNGVCMYHPHDDEWRPYYDCASDYECNKYEICESGYCESVGSPPPNCEGMSMAMPVPIDVQAEALALSFVDVDDDGQDELVVATQVNLLVFEDGGAAPAVSGLEAGLIEGMVAGSFDATPGEDALLLVGDSLVLYGSNGDGSFGPAVTSAAPIGQVNGLIAGDFDGQPPTDLLGWGGMGAFLERTGEVFVLDDELVSEAAVHELGSPAPGLALWRFTSTIDFYTFEAQPLGTATGLDALPRAIAAFTRGAEASYVHLVQHPDWSRVQARSPTTLGPTWPIYGNPQRLFSGDLDGDGNDELVFFEGVGVALEYDPRGPTDCWIELVMPVEGAGTNAAFGDHDGDGDQELAIRTNLGEVVLFDGG